jgi:glycosyltransferase involved in cell wall biosynthesis
MKVLYSCSQDNLPRAPLSPGPLVSAESVADPGNRSTTTMKSPQPYIVIDGRMILPHMTGAGRYLLGLCQGLNALPGDESIELWLQAGLPADHPAWGLASKRITLRSLPAAHLSLRGQWVLPAELRRARPDLLHYPHFDLPWLAPGRVVATLYDLKYIARPDFFPRARRLRRWAILTMTRHTLRRAERLIVTSQSTANDLVQRLDARMDKLRVIPLGVNENLFTPVSPEAIADARRRYGLQQPFVLFVGERRPHKNLDGLLRAFDSFRRRAPGDYHLAIIGRPYSSYHQPEAWAQSLGLGARTHFIDYAPDADLPLLYHAADALMLLSQYEGFGLPVLEAMACGTPVVVSNVTSLPEIVGDAGLTVPPDEAELAAEALLQVVPGAKEREQRIALGIERARRFTWERCARRTLEVYAEALAT